MSKKRQLPGKRAQQRAARGKSYSSAQVKPTQAGSQTPNPVTPTWTYTGPAAIPRHAPPRQPWLPGMISGGWGWIRRHAQPLVWVIIIVVSLAIIGFSAFFAVANHAPASAHPPKARPTITTATPTRCATIDLSTGGC